MRIYNEPWLAVSGNPAATVSGRYWYYHEAQIPAPGASDRRFQGQLVAKLTELTSVIL
jgi:hypothetical protein